MASTFFAFLFRISGWKVTGTLPHSIKKAIWVGAPHNSNWDLIIGIGARATIGFQIGFLAKNDLFKWYSGWLFKALGGFPVDRSKTNNLVDAVVSIFKENDTIHIALTPEGTRSDVNKLKTGFYYMALHANVPIILVGFDYTKKAFVIREPLILTGDYYQDMKIVYDFYLAIQSPHKSWLRTYAKTGVIPASR